MNTPYYFEHIRTITDFESEDNEIVSLSCEWKPSHKSGRTKPGNDWTAYAEVLADGSFKVRPHTPDDGADYYIPFGRFQTLTEAINSIRRFENDGEFGGHLANLTRNDYTVN